MYGSNVKKSSKVFGLKKSPQNERAYLFHTLFSMTFFLFQLILEEISIGDPSSNEQLGVSNENLGVSECAPMLMISSLTLFQDVFVHLKSQLVF